MHKIKEAFDQRGYTTVDFFAKLKALSKATALGNTQQQDVKTMIIQQSGADVYVEAEISLLESPSGNAMKVILSGYETSTANSLANAVCESGKFYTDDYGKLTSRAVEIGIDKFLNTMQEKQMEPCRKSLLLFRKNSGQSRRETRMAEDHKNKW